MSCALKVFKNSLSTFYEHKIGHNLRTSILDLFLIKTVLEQFMDVVLKQFKNTSGTVGLETVLE